MIVATMTPEQVVADARSDLRPLYNKIKPIMHKQERQHRKLKDRGATALVQHLEWCSPRGNNWLIVLRTIKDDTYVSNMVWYRGRDQRLRATQIGLLSDAPCAHFSAHMLERYGQRFNPDDDPVSRLKSFFFENYALSSLPIEDLGDGRCRILCGVMHGLITGYSDMRTNSFEFTTFLDHGRLSRKQWEFADALDMQRHLSSLSPGQRQRLLLDAEKLMAEQEGRRAA